MVSTQLAKVWDVWVRLFHWVLAAAVTFLLISGATGVGFLNWHRLAGELVFALLLFRFVWGFVGSSNARLTGLIVNPSLAVHHLRLLLTRTATQERGHNAAGGWAVLLMLALLTVQALTGMFIIDHDEWVEGAFYGVFPDKISHTLYSIHHINADLLKFIVLFHVVMIAIYFLYAKQNLIKPMLTGTMNWRGKAPPAEVIFGRFLVGLLVAIIVAIVVGLSVGWFR